MSMSPSSHVVHLDNRFGTIRRFHHFRQDRTIPRQ
jgi:hypothetical protein